MATNNEFVSAMGDVGQGKTWVSRVGEERQRLGFVKTVMENLEMGWTYIKLRWGKTMRCSIGLTHAKI